MAGQRSTGQHSGLSAAAGAVLFPIRDICRAPSHAAPRVLCSPAVMRAVWGGPCAFLKRGAPQSPPPSNSSREHRLSVGSLKGFSLSTAGDGEGYSDGRRGRRWRLRPTEMVMASASLMGNFSQRRQVFLTWLPTLANRLALLKKQTMM